MFVRSPVRCVFSTRNLSIYLSIYLSPPWATSPGSCAPRRGSSGWRSRSPTWHRSHPTPTRPAAPRQEVPSRPPRGSRAPSSRARSPTPAATCSSCGWSSGPAEARSRRRRAPRRLSRRVAARTPRGIERPSQRSTARGAASTRACTRPFPRPRATQHGQSAPLVAPALGACASSGRAWRFWAARHSQEEARPLSAQPLPRVLELAASNAAE